jgi:glutamate/tyrosine decarboxylase-like PLP-dependent enzyme
MIADDIAVGIQPLMVIATVGTTAVTSIDPVRQIAGICRRSGAYCYVDAAYGGAFACLPECQWVSDGWDLADAVCVNPHKALFVPQGCSVLFVRDRQAIRRACSHRADYLPQEEVTFEDPMDFSLWCGLRVNTLASLFTMLTFGAEGIRERLRHLRQCAQSAAKMISEDTNFELLREPDFSVVCFTMRAAEDGSRADRLVTRACELIQQQGECWLSRTRYQDREWFRLALGNINTTPRDVTFIIARVSETVATLQAELARF